MAKVCQNCGDIGFEEALVFCNACKVESLHRYCLGITPTPFTEYVTWFCEDCDCSDGESDCNEVDLTTKFIDIYKKKKKEKVSNKHTPPGFAVERSDKSDIEKSDELSGLLRNQPSVSEKGKKNKNTINHTMPVLDVVVNNSNVEPVNSKKQESSGNGKTTNKRKKEINEDRNNHTLPGLAVEATIVSTSPVNKCKEKESPYIGRPHEQTTGLVKSGASVSEAGDSSTVQDRSSCTSRKRKSSSGNIHVNTENANLAAANTSSKDGEPNLPPPAHESDRAQPIIKPVWRGKICAKEGKNRCIYKLVAHLSSLACVKVHNKASSFKAQLSAEIVHRLEIWPNSFLKKGPPTDKNIALYFFPSSESNDDEKVYYSLVGEMKKNDLAMRCLLPDNVDLLLFTSYQLPVNCWTFHSKNYLWGIFRRRATTRR